MYNIYTILCEDEKYLVHCTRTEETDMIYFECIILYEYARIHNPLQIIEKRYCSEFCDIDTEIKIKMYYYGINNVRGGSYRQPELSDCICKQLSEDIKTLTTRPMSDETYTKEFIDFFTTLEIDTKENCGSYIAQLENELVTHLKYKEKYNEFAKVNIYGNIFTITSSFIDELMWLFSKINNDVIVIKPECKARFEKIAIVIIHMVKLYAKEKELIDVNPVLLYPKIEFDKYIYHRASIIPTDNSIMNSIAIWNKIETIYYFVINKIDEHIFDMGGNNDTYGDDLRTKIDIFKTILNRM